MKGDWVAGCRKRGMSTVGREFDIPERICAYLDGMPIASPKDRARSRFNRHAGSVNRDMLITVGCNNPQSVRRFFRAEREMTFALPLP